MESKVPVYFTLKPFDEITNLQSYLAKNVTYIIPLFNLVNNGHYMNEGSCIVCLFVNIFLHDLLSLTLTSSSVSPMKAHETPIRGPWVRSLQGNRPYTVAPLGRAVLNGYLCLFPLFLLNALKYYRD